MWVSSPDRVIENIVLAHETDAQRFAHTRSVNVSGLSVRVGDMVETLRRVAGDAVAARVKWQRDPAIARLVESWPQTFATAFADSLGMRGDADFESIVRAYMRDQPA
jgi:hypothetical protein